MSQRIEGRVFYPLPEHQIVRADPNNHYQLQPQAAQGVRLTEESYTFAATQLPSAIATAFVLDRAFQKAALIADRKKAA